MRFSGCWAGAGLICAALGVLTAGSAAAADMPFFSPPAPEDGPVELGTGWYLRGDIAAARSPVLNIDGAVTANNFVNNWSAGLGFGYRYNSWLRTDLTADYQPLYSRSGAAYVATRCQIGAVGTPPGGPFTGSDPVYATCSPYFQSRATTAVFLGNVYVDLGTWGGITPYVGAGVGLDVMFQKSQAQWYQGNLVPYAGVTWTDPYTLGTYMANWDRSYSNTYLKFAYAFMGGFAYELTDHWTIDVGYRYLNLGAISGKDALGVTHSRKLDVQQVRLGFRYLID
ncbi:outer membrane protein [Methylosinus sp. Ce-a6]|uniref:outer membrane protein n=1 Tax=Methylosinus sp. Ce-a6 TaxID=2172005 RepID=UPI00135B0A61|nr:outer membrane beta-barrel protein [Methylosinus sp. Ce-a6]